jgi:molybdopterin molybdotransferase
VLAVDVRSDVDVPPFDTAAADGFALRAVDSEPAGAESPVTLSVVESVPAGTVPTKAVGHGEATRTRTGAPVPAGADAVVKGDRVEFEPAGGGEGGAVRVERPVRSGQNVRRKGSDVSKGEVVLAEGEAVSRAGIALLAAVGASAVDVYRKPRVAIVSASDALVDLDRAPGPGEIRDSNSWSLSAQTMEAGGMPLRLGTASYDDTIMRDLVERAEAFDVIISSGGVGAGETDFVRSALGGVGTFELLEPAIRPGSPLLLGRVDEAVYFGLPGNPTGSLVAFELFVRPALRRMQGYRDVRRTEVTATLTHDVRKKPGRAYFLCGRLEPGGHISRTVTLTRGRGKGLLRSMHGSNCLVHFAAGETQFPTGTPVSCIRLDVTEGTP